MARKRMIDPGIWQSEQIASLSREARLLFIGIFSNADDAGRIKASGRYLKMLVFPGDEDITATIVEKWRDAIATATDGNGQAPIRLYSVSGMEYLDLPNWMRYQRIDRPSASLLPSFDEGSTNARRMITDRSTTARRQIRLEEIRLEEINTSVDKSTEAAHSKITPAPKAKGPNPGLIINAFKALGFPEPSFERGEGKAAQSLLREGYSPDEIAQCWQDHATGEYGDGFSQRDLSFDYLATRQRIANWKRWLVQGRPSANSRSNRDVPTNWRSSQDATNRLGGDPSDHGGQVPDTGLPYVGLRERNTL